MKYPKKVRLIYNDSLDCFDVYFNNTNGNTFFCSQVDTENRYQIIVPLPNIQDYIESMMYSISCKDISIKYNYQYMLYNLHCGSNDRNTNTVLIPNTEYTFNTQCNISMRRELSQFLDDILENNEELAKKVDTYYY